eukprot:g54948.t1
MRLVSSSTPECSLKRSNSDTAIVLSLRPMAEGYCPEKASGTEKGKEVQEKEGIVGEDEQKKKEETEEKEEEEMRLVSSSTPVVCQVETKRKCPYGSTCLINDVFPQHAVDFDHTGVSSAVSTPLPSPGSRHRSSSSSVTPPRRVSPTLQVQSCFDEPSSLVTPPRRASPTLQVQSCFDEPRSLATPPRRVSPTLQVQSGFDEPRSSSPSTAKVSPSSSISQKANFPFMLPNPRPSPSTKERLLSETRKKKLHLQLSSSPIPSRRSSLVDEIIMETPRSSVDSMSKLPPNCYFPSRRKTLPSLPSLDDSDKAPAVSYTPKGMPKSISHGNMSQVGRSPPPKNRSLMKMITQLPKLRSSKTNHKTGSLSPRLDDSHSETQHCPRSPVITGSSQLPFTNSFTNLAHLPTETLNCPRSPVITGTSQLPFPSIASRSSTQPQPIPRQMPSSAGPSPSSQTRRMSFGGFFLPLSPRTTRPLSMNTSPVTNTLSPMSSSPVMNTRSSSRMTPSQSAGTISPLFGSRSLSSSLSSSPLHSPGGLKPLPKRKFSFSDLPDIPD